jgi:hypothetical protein
MTFHTAAFYEDIDPAAAFVPITAVPEQMIFTDGDNLRVPDQLPFIIGAAAAIGDASGLRAQVAAPSLRMLANYDIEPVVLADVFGSPPETNFHPQRAIPLTPDEAVNFYVESNPAAAEQHYGGVWLADGPQTPVVGNFFSIRAVGAITQVLTAWTNGNLTFAQTLPAGRYQVIGMRARSADALFARLVFPEQVARPGVPCVNAIGDTDIVAFRFGNAGVFGEFPSTNPPTLDVIGGAGTAQYLILDMVRVS